MFLKKEFEDWYENHTDFTDYEAVKQIWEACENCMIEAFLLTGLNLQEMTSEKLGQIEMKIHCIIQERYKQ